MRSNSHTFQNQLISFTLFFLPLFVLLSSAMWVMGRIEIDHYRHKIQVQDKAIVDSQKRLADILFQQVLSDLDILAQGITHASEMVSEVHYSQFLKQTFHTFLSEKKYYDQARIIAPNGMEVIRVDFRNGLPVIQDPKLLQDKSKRYYFRNAIRLAPNEVYISPLDLSIEHGKIEHPLKPALRLATPVFDYHAKKIGVLVLNFLAQNLLDTTRQHSFKRSEGSKVMLLNSDGYWLHGASNQQNWGFMFPHGASWRFQNKYPQAWKLFSDQSQGQFETNQGAFTHINLDFPEISKKLATHNFINPYSSRLSSSYLDRLILLVYRPKSALSYGERNTIDRLIQLYMLATAILVLGGWGFMRLRISRQQAFENREKLHAAQVVVDLILKKALQDDPLVDQLKHALENILTLSWLSDHSRGAIFLVEEGRDELVMVVEQGLHKTLLTECARLPYGKCLCGLAAQTSEVIFANCLDQRHSVRYDEIQPHGHYCLPILSNQKLIGILTLYLVDGHVQDASEEELLQTVTKALASVIERKWTDEQLAIALREIKSHRDKLQFERSFIENILIKIRSSDQFEPFGIRYLMAPVEKTAGDLLLSARRPDGVRHIFLGDFTGHGLPSAIGAPTVSDIFYSMTDKGFPAEAIVNEINQKLTLKLPTGIYLTACFLELDSINHKLTVWNAGLPEILIFRNGQRHHTIESENLPLGILDTPIESSSKRLITTQPGDHIYAFTDGVTEPHGHNLEMFGLERLEPLLEEIISNESSLEIILSEIQDYQVTDEQADDITLVEVHC
ncbi:MAG: SpoIIE family protein phosphatase [Magnetococcales bacterium]|nr:SpoIIE family protein phosphatase [Magnetococcales bacterium]